MSSKHNGHGLQRASFASVVRVSPPACVGLLPLDSCVLPLLRRASFLLKDDCSVHACSQVLRRGSRRGLLPQHHILPARRAGRSAYAQGEALGHDGARRDVTYVAPDPPDPPASACSSCARGSLATRVGGHVYFDVYCMPMPLSMSLLLRYFDGDINV